MADLNDRLGVTILLVTHDPVFAAMAKRVLRLVDGSLEQAMAFDEDDEALAASKRTVPHQRPMVAPCFVFSVRSASRNYGRVGVGAFW